jgi:DNA-binding MarR family transcriptional regulator
MNALLDGNESLSKKLRRIAGMYTTALANSLMEFDIDRYFDVLLILSEQSELLTQKRLAEVMHIDKSRIVTILYYLSQKGYVRIEKNPKDRREHFVLLTDKGNLSIPLIKAAIKKNNKLSTMGLSAADFNKCLTMLSIIEKNLKRAF